MKKNLPKADQSESKENLQQKVLELIREILGGITLASIKHAESLEGQERLEFCKYAFFVCRSPHFKTLMESIYYGQVMFTALKASNYDEVSFGRATANGIKLMKEFFEKYANEYETNYLQPKERFDPNKAFASVQESIYQPT